MISKAFFNTKWLEQANLEMPTTVDEITEAFRAFKPIADANDGVALALFNQNDMFSWLGGAYGLANRGNANTWIDADPTDSTGNTLWTNVTGKIGSKAGLLITKQCEHPEALVGWVDYFYTTQGAMDYFLGEEGVSYILNEDGTTELTPYVTNNPDGLDQAAVQYKYSLAGGNPGLATDQTFKGGETYWTSLEGSDKYRPYIPEIVWEKFPVTAE